MPKRSPTGRNSSGTLPLPMAPSTWKAVTQKLALSSQQLRIVELILRGQQDKEIAEELGVSFYTVRTYLKRVFDRLDVNGRNGLILHIFALAQAETTA